LEDDAVNGAPAVKPAGGVTSTEPRVSTPATGLPVLLKVNVSTTVLPAMTVLGDNVVEYDARPAAVAVPGVSVSNAIVDAAEMAAPLASHVFLRFIELPPLVAGPPRPSRPENQALALLTFGSS
jgi:hypothetical protein